MADVPTLQQAGLSQMTPGQIDINQLSQPGAATTSQQLAGILGQGGALMQQSATTGNQQAASRGLLNSSMGIQAAQNAMISQAAPIAQADANALNNMSQFNAQATNNAQQFNVGQANTANQFNTQQANAMSTWNAGQQNEALLKDMDLDSRETLANIEANYKTLMQSSSSASGMYEQMLKNLSEIEASKDMDATAKQTAITNQLTYLRTGLTMIQNMNGLTGMVTF